MEVAFLIRLVLSQTNSSAALECPACFARCERANELRPEKQTLLHSTRNSQVLQIASNKLESTLTYGNKTREVFLKFDARELQIWLAIIVCTRYKHEEDSKWESGRYDIFLRSPLHVVLIWRCGRIISASVMPADETDATCSPYWSRQQQVKGAKEGSLAEVHFQRGPTSARLVLETFQMASLINEERLRSRASWLSNETVKCVKEGVFFGLSCVVVIAATIKICDAYSRLWTLYLFPSLHSELHLWSSPWLQVFKWKEKKGLCGKETKRGYVREPAVQKPPRGRECKK